MTARKSAPRRPGKRAGRTVWLAAMALAVVAAAIAVVWLPGRGAVSHAYTLAPESVLPANFKNAPPDVREAYRFAIANRDVLRQIPCYCNCGNEHQSNAECYIKEIKPDGAIVFDPMSYG